MPAVAFLKQHDGEVRIGWQEATMTMLVNPYLMFAGNCEAAFKHYEKALGGRIVELARFADAPKGAAPADKKTANWVMHVRLEVGNNVIMGSDAPSEHFQAPQGMSVSVNVDDPEQAETIFAALADGGRQTMPMAETFWARRFGMLVDRYGIPWMVNCQKSGPAR